MYVEWLKSLLRPKENKTDGELLVRVYADQRMIIKTVGKAKFYQKGDAFHVTEFYSKLKSKPRISKAIEAERITVSLSAFPDLESEVTFGEIFMVDPNLSTLTLSGKGNKNGAFLTLT